MLLLAQDGGGSALASFLPLILIGAFFWFVMIRPQRKRQQERKQMMDRLAVGNDVVTIGGLHGQVEQLGDGWVDLLVNDDVVLRFSRTAIGEVVTPADLDEVPPADDTPDDADELAAADDEAGWPDREDG